jgi:hypothetical protein
MKSLIKRRTNCSWPWSSAQCLARVGDNARTSSSNTSHCSRHARWLLASPKPASNQLTTTLAQNPQSFTLEGTAAGQRKAHHLLARASPRALRHHQDHAQDGQAARDALRAVDPSGGADHQPLQLPSPGRLGRASAGAAGEACAIPSTAADGAARADGPDVEGSSESRTQVETTNIRVPIQAHSALKGRKRGLARGRPRRRPTTR